VTTNEREKMKLLKPGHLTTEFWATVFTVVGTVAGALAGVVSAPVAAVVGAVASGAYAVSRGLAKKS